MSNVREHFIDCDPDAEGYTVMSDTDDFDIFINAHLCAERAHEVYNHEMEHIQNRDYEHILSVEDVERKMIK